jgi:predicted HicB family RNase H-like nuclease
LLSSHYYFYGTFARGKARAGISPSIHQRVDLNALSKGKTINKYITEVLEKAFQDH